MKKYFVVSLFSAVAVALAITTPAFAHVVVKPSQVNVATFQTFTMGVPNEKEVAVIAVRLLIPEGLKEVSPNVKPGWKVETKKSGDSITEINWTGGSIPAGMRDEFSFSAQAPAAQTNLNWKAYQTYQGGVVAAWDHDPSATHEHNDSDENATGPYSVTTVINDLVSSPTPDSMSAVASAKADRTPLIISIAALAIAVLALGKATMSHTH